MENYIQLGILAIMLATLSLIIKVNKEHTKLKLFTKFILLLAAIWFGVLMCLNILSK